MTISQKLATDLSFKPPEQWYEVIHAAIEEAVEEEREACAQIADNWRNYEPDMVGSAIRERGKQPTDGVDLRTT
jgi:hypothetical protein